MKTDNNQAPAIEVLNLVMRFGSGAQSVVALDNVSLSIAQNEFFTLLGPSGCGKTTLLRLIAGFEAPTEGEIRLMGTDISMLPPFKRSINTVFQNYALFPHMSVSENIGFGLKMLGRPANEINARVDEMLELVQLTQMANRRIDQISGGQQQRVALARALAPAPDVLLLDEPLSALDYKLRKEMQVELKRLQTETGITFVFVTHDQEEALAMSDRVAVISAGKVLQVGAPRTIYAQPANRFVAEFIGETNMVEAVVEAHEDTGLRLSVSGETLIAGTHKTAKIGDKVTVMIRPEHASLVAASMPEGLSATFQEQTFFGTDTHYALTLTDGTAFTVREQNTSIADSPYQPGQPVKIVVKPGLAQVLEG